MRRISAAIPADASCTTRVTNLARRSSATTRRDRFGFAPADLEDLVKWSIVIDGAQYPDAKTAVELGAPAMKLTLVIESAKGSGIVRKIIGWMQTRQLSEIVAEPEIQALYAPLYQRHLDSIEIIGRLAVEDDGVVFFDLAGHDIEGYNKFIPYNSISRFHLHGVGNCRELAHQDLGRVESVGAGGAEA